MILLAVPALVAVSRPASAATLPPGFSESGQYIEWYEPAGKVVFREYYNLNADRFQLTNLLADGNPDNNPDTTALSARLARYKTCRGRSGANPCP